MKIFRGATSGLGAWEALENDDFPRSHVVPGAFLGNPKNEDFPRSHVGPGSLGGARKRRFSEEPRRALGRLGCPPQTVIFSSGKLMFSGRF